jgi:tRNA 2-selenouridine synthase
MMAWTLQCGTAAILRKNVLPHVSRSSRRACAVLVQETGVSSLLDEVRTSSPWVIDVRAPIEYNKGHIPGAISVPLLDDEGRAAVGKAFKTTDRFEAMKTGLKRVKLADIVTCLEQDHGCRPGADVYVYCSRGGMRSESVAWLLNICGYNAQKVISGYKDYRKRAVLKCLELGKTPGGCPINVIAGRTGVGKTAVLSHLASKGERVICLETMAKHKGSVFGRIGEIHEQPSNEQFENNLSMLLYLMHHGGSPDRPIWIEHEGSNLGKVNIPPSVREWIRSPPNGGKTFVLEMDMSHRVERLISDYGSSPSTAERASELIECMTRPKGGLRKKLGEQRLREVCKALESDQASLAANLLIQYYDSLYKKWEPSQREGDNGDNIHHIRCRSGNAAANAALVLKASNHD